MIAYSNCRQISTSQFIDNVLLSGEKSLVEFYSNWSGGSHMMAPLLESIAAVYQDQINFYCVDADTEKELSERFNIQTIPTILFFDQGEIVEGVVGLVPRDEIIRKVKDLIANC